MSNSSLPNKSNATVGRERLQLWNQLRPDNYFEADSQLQETLEFQLGHDAYSAKLQRWNTFGEHCANSIEDNLDRIERANNYPNLQRYSGIGERIEAIEFDPGYHEIGRHVYASRITADYDKPGQETAQLVTQYLLCHNGEAGHACPLACGAGLVKMLSYFAKPTIRDKFLPKLLDPNYDTNFQASQFLTEVQGGSDVGANAVIAKLQPDGSALISGEKWFCSVVNADCFLMTARVIHADGSSKPGTAGLGAFVVPRKLESGQTNNFFIRRLKDKLGTKHMASAELDFENAVAFPLCAPESAFKNVVSVVLTTSRIYNAVSCCGMMRRAEIEAFNYAKAREAFGRPIVKFPLIQLSLANLRAEVAANTASTFAIAKMADAFTLNELSKSQQQAFRMLVPMNKLLTAIRTTEIVHEAMEILGGNGAIEEFSVLPRLYRDAYVLEAWEGTHNVLAAQLARDIAKYQIHEGWLNWCTEQLQITQPALEAAKARIETELNSVLIPSLKTFADPNTTRAASSIAIRGWSEQAMIVSQAICLLTQADWAIRNDRETLSVELLFQFLDKHHVGESSHKQLFLTQIQLDRINILSLSPSN